MNPLQQKPKFEPSPYAIVSSISDYMTAVQKVSGKPTGAEAFPIELRRKKGLYIPQIPVSTTFPVVTMVIGKVGSGKSTRLKRFAEYRIEQGTNCVLDLNDYGGFEGACYALPNTNREVWENFNAVMMASGNQPMRFVGRAYPTIQYVPATRGVPTRLPVFFRPFRIAFQTLEFDEFITLCGFQRGEVATEILELAWLSRPHGERFENFIRRAVEMCATGSIRVRIRADKDLEVPTAERRSFPPLLRKLKVLWDLNLLCDEGDPLALDLHEMLMDTHNIHSFSMAWIDRLDVPFLIYGYLIRRIYNLRKNPQNRYPNLYMIVREAQKLAPYQMEFDGQEISRACLRALARECRHLSTWIYLDTQDQSSIDPILRRQVFTWYIFMSDKVVIDLLRGLFYMADTVAHAIPKLPIGFCAIHHRTYSGVPSVYLPPLSHVKAYSEKFLELWTQRHGVWKDFKITFPDSEDVIQFQLPSSEPEDYLAKPPTRKEMQVIHRMVLTAKNYIAQRSKTTMKEMASLFDVTPQYLYNRFLGSAEFLSLMDYNSTTELITLKKAGKSEKLEVSPP
jgi:hypothetical protein